MYVGKYAGKEHSLQGGSESRRSISNDHKHVYTSKLCTVQCHSMHKI